MCIVVGDEAIPLAANDRYRRGNECRIVGEMTGMSLGDFLRRAIWYFHALWRACSAFRIGFEIQRSPFIEVMPGKNRGLVRWHVFRKPVSLFVQRH